MSSLENNHFDFADNTLFSQNKPQEEDDDAIQEYNSEGEPDFYDNIYEKENEEENLDVLEITEDIVNKTKTVPSDFQMLSVLGRGGYGKVFLARKVTGNDSGELFAMKVLKKACIMSNRRDLEHTKSERNILQMIKHPFLVQLYYAFQTYGRLYLALEYLPGGELFTQLERNYKLNEDAARFYLSEITLALGHLHSLGVIYRDLKPENVLLDLEGHVKLTDFGLCKESILNENDMADTFCGTIEYMAPEVIERIGHGKVVDWWSLGTLTYDMLVGHSPFISENRSDTMQKIRRCRYFLPNDLSPMAKDFIKSLLKRHVRERLGYGENGVERVKQHKFFDNIDWFKCYDRQLVPPFRPNLTSDIDVSLFDPKFTHENPIETPDDGIPLKPPRDCVAGSLSEIFQGFSYVAPDVQMEINTEPWIATSTSLHSINSHKGQSLCKNDFVPPLNKPNFSDFNSISAEHFPSVDNQALHVLAQTAAEYEQNRPRNMYAAGSVPFPPPPPMAPGQNFVNSPMYHYAHPMPTMLLNPQNSPFMPYTTMTTHQGTTYFNQQPPLHHQQQPIYPSSNQNFHNSPYNISAPPPMMVCNEVHTNLQSLSNCSLIKSLDQPPLSHSSSQFNTRFPQVNHQQTFYKKH